MKAPDNWPGRGWRLVNAPTVDALPAASVRARGNHDARTLAQSRWLLRRKHDGRYLATLDAGGRLHALHGSARRHDSGLAELLRALEGGDTHDTLPTGGTEAILHALGVPADYGERHGLALVPEPATLWFAGFDRYRRPLWMEAAASRAWQRMREAAKADEVVLEAISAFRSHDYQLGIFRRKLLRGLALEDILRVNAAPGFSEHHSGRALDLSCPGAAAAEESFEDTAAFEWLRGNAGRFGFVLSYPRDNPNGIVYEPWHWCHRPQDVRSASIA